MRQFTFLICSERSGSNFITSLMNGHSQISGPPPTHLFRLFGTNRGNYDDLTVDWNWKILIDDVVLNFDCKLGYWQTILTAEELKQQAQKRSVADLLRVIYEKEAGYDGASHVFVKENHTYSFVPFLFANFPGCRFIFMVRDPRDVASSWVRTDSIPGGVEKAVEIWVKDQTASLSLYHQLRDSECIQFIRYEDLVKDAPRVLMQLTDFLGLSYEDGMLEYYEQRRTDINAHLIDAWSNLRKPILSHNTGKYHDILSMPEIRYVELSCYDLMSNFGYSCDLISPCSAINNRHAQLEELRPELTAGSYHIQSDQEREIRGKRLAAIQQVLTRRI